MDILENPWFIGIVGGIISGTFVAFITRHLFSRREKKEYRQRVETANNEIIYAVRPSIAEKMLPSRSILDSLITATAKKYAVTKSDLYSLAGLSNELIKEIMANTFLASQQKIEFCELISSLKQIEKNEDKKRIEIVTVTKNESFDPSIFLGAMTAIMTILMIVYLKFKDKDPNAGLLSEMALPFTLALVVPAVAYGFVEILKKHNRFLQLRSEDSKRSSKIKHFENDEKLKNSKTNKQPNHDNAADAKSRAAD